MHYQTKFALLVVRQLAKGSETGREIYELVCRASFYRGNRVIECGVISLVLVFAEGIAAKSNAPDWVLESLGVLLLLMCFLTVALFARECYQGIRRWLRKPS